MMKFKKIKTKMKGKKRESIIIFVLFNGRCNP